MNETNFDWDDLRLFLAVARARGLSPAADATDKSAPTLGRRMLALERHLGQELFRRLPRGYELTDEGDALLARAEVLERQLAPLMDAPGRSVPVVKVSAGLWVTHLLCAHVDEIIGGAALKLRFIAADDLVDIGRREAVIGVRNHRPEATGLAGRRIADVRFAEYASHPGVTRWAQVIGTTPSAQWARENRKADDIIEVTSPRNALDLALEGAARVVLPTFIGRRWPSLQQVSEPIEALDHAQWLVTHHEDRFEPEVRGVIDRLAGVLQRQVG